MQDFTVEPRVNLVIIPFRSFLHLTTSDDQLRTLANVRASLVPGGLLALNMFVPDPALIAAREGRRVLQSEFTDEAGRRCELWSVPSYEAATQRLRVRAIREAYEGETVADVAEAVLDLRLVYPGEMEHLLARAGFEVEARYGWFDERPFGPESEEMIWVARRT